MVFVDVIHDGSLVQCVVNRATIEDRGVNLSSFAASIGDLHRGDAMSMLVKPLWVRLLTRTGFRGRPHRTTSNELSVLATELPRLLSRCSNNLPEKIKDAETRAQNRHVAYLTDRTGTDILRFRSKIIGTIRKLLQEKGYVEVQTPVLAESAGGATARPFTTQATEFEGRELALRIAPELWLKRLVVGGLEQIFEIGPSFRNEGTSCSCLDASLICFQELTKVIILNSGHANSTMLTKISNT